MNRIEQQASRRHGGGRWVRVATGVLAVTLAAPAGQAQAGGHQGDARERGGEDQRHDRGKHHERDDAALAGWLLTYMTNALTGTPGAVIDGARMLEIPAGALVSGSGTFADPAFYEGSMALDLAADTPFVLPVAVWYGERYDPVLTHGQPDDPILPDSVFTRSTAKVTVDGVAVLDSARGLEDNYVPPAYFDPLLVYPAPTPYGSVAAVYVQGLAIHHRPLKKGVHTMELRSELIVKIPDYSGPGATLDLGLRWHNTWTLTVH